MEGKLTVVTQQQTCFSVFVHINSCDKIDLQAETGQFSAVDSTSETFIRLPPRDYFSASQSHNLFR